jgi:hypothetical protein
MKQALAIPTLKQNFTPCARGKEVKYIDIRHPFIRDLVQKWELNILLIKIRCYEKWP